MCYEERVIAMRLHLGRKKCVHGTVQPNRGRSNVIIFIHKKLYTIIYASILAPITTITNRLSFWVQPPIRF